jgi:hypothetical protein
VFHISRSIIILVRKKALRIGAALLVCIGLLWGVSYYVKSTQSSFKPSGGEYVILANNDTGMHCIQPDYSAFLILPPGNNLGVQVFEKGKDKAELITSGITLEYEVNDNTSSADKVNFWEYAKDYGYDIAPNVGITGNKLKGVLKLSSDKKYFEVTAIPVVPYNDGQKQVNPYQTVKITVKDSSSGKVLAVQDKVVLPVSDEMMCSNCHGTQDTDKNILMAHDGSNGTKLYTDLTQGKRHRCNECHSDNVLNAPGKDGLPALSQAIHGFHSSRMGMSKLANQCYNCHPGEVTKCNRGVMAANGITCADSKCHGSMENVSQTILNGRRPWLDEPDCGACHGADYAVNIGMLYRSSYLVNGPDDMNGEIKCISCHNSAHSEWPSTLPLDNVIPVQLYGRPDFIRKCSACHEGTGKLHGAGR